MDVVHVTVGNQDEVFTPRAGPPAASVPSRTNCDVCSASSAHTQQLHIVSDTHLASIHPITIVKTHPLLCRTSTRLTTSAISNSQL